MTCPPHILTFKTSWLLALSSKVEAKIEAVRERARVAAAAAAAEEARAAALAAALAARGIHLGTTDVVPGMGGYRDAVYLDADDDNTLHWPLSFLYEEHSQMDYLRDVDERTALCDHLDMVFAERPGWDTEGAYRPEDLEVYFLAHCITKQSAAERLRVWVRVPLDDPKDRTGGTPMSMRAIVNHPMYEVPRIMMLWVISAASPYRRQFLKSRRVVEFDDL